MYLLQFFLFLLKKKYLKSIVVVRDMYRLSVSCFGYDCTQSIKFKPIKIISPFVKLTCFVLSCRRLPFKIMNCCMSFENQTTLQLHDLHQVYYLKANLANTILHRFISQIVCHYVWTCYNSLVWTCYNSMFWTKLQIPSTPNIDLILWHTHLIVCAVK